MGYLARRFMGGRGRGSGMGLGFPSTRRRSMTGY
jgi:hypothetical protein